MRPFLATAFILAPLFTAAAAHADRIQLADDPRFSAGVSTGTFLGHGRKTGFERIQPITLHLEIGLLRTTERRWFNRLNLYGSASYELTNLSFHNTLGPMDTGMLTGRFSGDSNWSGGAGLRLSVYDSPHFHMDLFGEYSGSFSDAGTSVDSFVVRVNGSDLELAYAVKDHVRIMNGWHMTHFGATFGFPLRRRSMGRVTPFFSVGYLLFESGVHITLDQTLQDLVTSLMIQDKVPTYKNVYEETFSGAIGCRLDLGDNNALEANGAFIRTPSGTSAYWVTGSYTLRFDLW